MGLFFPFSLNLHHPETVPGQASRHVSISVALAVPVRKRRLGKREGCVRWTGSYGHKVSTISGPFSSFVAPVCPTPEWLGILAWRTLEITEDTGHWPSKNSTLGPL